MQFKGLLLSKHPTRASSLLDDETLTHTISQTQESEQIHYYHHTHKIHRSLEIKQKIIRSDISTLTAGGKLRMGRIDRTCHHPSTTQWMGQGGIWEK